MKVKRMFLGCLVGVVVLAMGYPDGGNRDIRAQSKGDTTSLEIGTVSILKIFRDCKRSAAHRSQLIAEQRAIVAELERLSIEIQAEEAGLKALKIDSSDYMVRRKEIINKRFNMEAQQEFSKEQMILNQYKWSKELYQEILSIVSELAGERGLDLVIEKDEIDLLAFGINELSQTIRTHKVLYSGGCVDISDEVVARLDKE